MSQAIDSQTEMNDEVKQPSVSGCPRHASQEDLAILNMDDELICPHYRRMVSEYVIGESGGQEFHIYYGEKDITFDEPELFAFGEGVARHERFVACDATSWGTGYHWSQVQELLGQLLAEGILQRGSLTERRELSSTSTRGAVCASPLPSSQATVPYTWNECEAITRELTGHSLETAYLESLIPIYRVAHIAVDAEGRQVGEANVFPSQLRLNVPTEWHTCMYKGSRFQNDNPMNVTALKSMKALWNPTMVLVQRIRDRYLHRFPEVRQGWTVGDLERFTTAILTVPAYLLMRVNKRVENYHLHPVFSSMFRVTDGVRMAMHTMLFIHVAEPTRAPETPITSKEIYDFAERTGLLVSSHGVCAGPRNMIEQFLRILVDGEAIEGSEAVVLDESVTSALDDIESAFDYALYGLQAHAVVFSLWNIIARTYEQLWALLDKWQGMQSDEFIRFRQHLEEAVTYIRARTFVGTEELRSSRERVFANMYEKSASGLGGKAVRHSLAAHLTPVSDAHHNEVASKLRVIVQQRLWPVSVPDEKLLDGLVICLMDYLRQEQAVVLAACEIQQRINDLLGRSSPKQRLTGWGLYIYHEFQEMERRPPYLLTVLKEGLGVQITVTQDWIELTDTMAKQELCHE